MTEPKVTSAVVGKLGFSEEHLFRLEELLDRPPTHAELSLLAAYRERMSPSERVKRIRDSMPRGEAASQQPSNVVSIEVDGSAMNVTARIGGCAVKVRKAADKMACGAIMTLLRELTDEGALPQIAVCGQVVGSHETLGIRALSEKLGLAMKECNSSAGIDVAAPDFFSDADLGSTGLFSPVILGVTASMPDAPATVRQDGNPVYFLSQRSRRSSKGRFAAMQICSQLSHHLMHRPYLIELKSVSEDGLGVAAARISAEHGMGITLDAARFPAAQKTSAMATILLHAGRHGLLAVISKGFEGELIRLSKEFKVDCHRIGKTSNSQMLTVKRSKKTVVSLPVELLEKVHESSAEQTGSVVVSIKPEMVDATALKKTRSYRGALLSLLASPNVAETVRRSELKVASADSVSPLVEVSSSGRTLGLDPRVGGRTAVASAARKLVCRGINPAAAVLNTFVAEDVSREQDELLREVFQGADEVARVFDIPIIDTKTTTGEKISAPVAVAGVIGAASQNFRPLMTKFKQCGDFVLMLGSHRGELGGSEYLRIVAKKEGGPPPAVDLRVEPKLRDIVLMAHTVDLIESATNVSSGGLAAALAQCVLNSPQGTGARIHMSSKITDQKLLFGETQGVVIVTVHEEAIIEIERICMQMAVPCTAIGRVTDDSRFSFNDLINVKVSELQKKHKEGLNIFRRAVL